MNKVNEELYKLLGINPEGAREKAFTQGLLSSIFQAAALSGPQSRPISTAQALGQVGLAGMGAYESSFDKTLKEALTGLQVKDLLRKQTEEQQLQKARQRYTQRMQELQGGITTPSMALASGQGPTPAAAATLGQPIKDITGQQQSAAMELLGATKPELLAAEVLKPREAPGVVGEYAAAKRLGYVAPETTLADYISQVKKPLVQNIVGGKASPFEEAAQKKQAEVFSGLQESGSKAARSLQSVEKLDNILNRVETGGVAAFKQIAGNFGIPTKGLNDIQAAQSIINKLVPEQRPPGSGTMSDADLILYKESLPRIINQPGANKIIVQSMKDINNYLVKEGQIATDVLDNKISPSEGRKKLLELGNPIEKFFEQNPNFLPSGSGVQVSPEDRSLINKYLNRR